MTCVLWTGRELSRVDQINQPINRSLTWDALMRVHPCGFNSAVCQSMTVPTDPSPSHEELCVRSRHGFSCSLFAADAIAGTTVTIDGASSR